MQEAEPVDALGILLAGLLDAEAEAAAPPPSTRRRIESGVFRIELSPDDDAHPPT